MSALHGELTWGVEGPPFHSPKQPLGFILEPYWGSGVSYLRVSKSRLDLILGRQLWVAGLDQVLVLSPPSACLQFCFYVEQVGVKGLCVRGCGSACAAVVPVEVRRRGV